MCRECEVSTNPVIYSKEEYTIHSTLVHNWLLKVCRDNNIDLVWEVSAARIKEAQREQHESMREVISTKGLSAAEYNGEMRGSETRTLLWNQRSTVFKKRRK